MKLEPEKSKRIKTPPRPTGIPVPTDFSRNAEEALRFAVPLARQLGGKITLLHSIDWQVNPCPVLTVRPVAGAKVRGAKAASFGPIIKRILVPIVLSEGCDSSVRFATALARMMHAQLILLHVVAPLPLNSSRYIAEVQQYDAEVKLDAKQRLESLPATLPPDIQSEVMLRQNTPHLGIIGAAHERRCDLITLPTRDLTSIKDFVLGSTAEKVIRHAPCPVLTFNRHSTATQRVTSKKPSSINIHSQQ
jgi:universal stress protein A